MYRSSILRVYYGAGDYSRRAAFVPGYYPAGGFFSSLGKLASKGVSAVRRVVSNPLVSTAASLLPGGSLITKAVNLAAPILSAGSKVTASGLGAIGAVRSSFAGVPLLGTGLADLALGGSLTKQSPVVNALTGTSPLQKALASGLLSEKGAPKRRRRRRSKYRRPPQRRRRTRRRRRSSYSRGDWGDPRGRDKRGHFLASTGGHRHFRRRRRRGRGGRVSFVTKSGKRVSFTAR